MTRLRLTSSPNRRGVVAGIGSTAFFLSTPVRASTTSEAEALIGTVLTEVLGIIDSGKNLGAILADFEGIFERYGDPVRIASSILGPPWRQMSDAEQGAYVEALTGYVSRKYGKRFREFQGGKITITKSEDYGRKGIIVQSMVSSNTFQPYRVEWHVIETRRGLRFFDIIIEGVKLLAAERAEVRAVLDRVNGSIPQLIAALRQMG